MLVLTRKSNQSIMIGDDIEVSVLSIMGEKVRIGIQAPRDIPVFRKEVYLEIQQENVAAGASARAEVDDALKRLSANNQRKRRSEALAQQVVQGLEHRDRHDDRGAEQHQHEQEEAHRAVAVRALAVALGLPQLRAPAQPLATLTILLDLLEEGVLDLGDALAHAHGRRKANSGSITPARRAAPARRGGAISAACATFGGMVSGRA